MSRVMQSPLSCNSYKFNEDLKKTKNILGGNLISNNQAMPCGLYSSLYP
jgi:hypothetical protein